MVDILGGIMKALQLIFSGDPTLYGILFRSLFFSGSAVVLAALWGTPIAMLVSLKDFRGKTIIKGFFNSLIGIPTVVLGLVLFLIFSKGGPLGFLGLLYTPAAIILGEAILVTPILISIMTSAIESVDPEIINLVKTLGASESQAAIAVLKEALNGVLLSNIASFNRAIAELGVALLVGGNIAGSTDILTTAISRYTARGDLSLAVALGIFLMIIIFGINLIVITARRLKLLSILRKSPQ
ncbi:MAG: ABC transporter permease [Candidatus Bathyarchaeota archaeon]|jgi:tungstate transport system permease protein|nr:ABC transporter permease [Candidatus Bathyarchaeota archaeon]